MRATDIVRAVTVRYPKAAYSVKADLGRSALTHMPDRIADGLIKLMLRP